VGVQEEKCSGAGKNCQVAVVVSIMGRVYGLFVQSSLGNSFSANAPCTQHF